MQVYENKNRRSTIIARALAKDTVLIYYISVQCHYVIIKKDLKELYLLIYKCIYYMIKREKQTLKL